MSHAHRAAIKHIEFGLVFGLAGVLNVAAQDSITPGQLRVDATFENLGVVWFVSGDDDLDSAAVLGFRQLGAVAWRAASRPMCGSGEIGS